MTSEQSSPARYKTRAHALDHIEIHEDALLVTQLNVHLSTAGLEAAFADLKLNHRAPLAEIELKAAQYSERDREATNVSGETCSVGEGTIFSAKPSVYNSIASPSRTPQQQPKISHETPQLLLSPPNDRALETLSPANHKIQFDRAAATSHSENNPICQEQTSIAARSPLRLQKRHMALTPTPRTSLSARQEITIPKRNKGDRSDASDFSATRAVMSSPAVKRSVSNKENLEPLGTPLRNSSAYDILEAAVIEAATPPTQSHAQYADQPLIEDAVSSEDILQEMEEDVSVDAASPACTVVIESAEKTATQQPEQQPSDVPATSEDVQNVDVVTQTNAAAQSKTKKIPVVRITKAAQARIDLAHRPQDVPRAPAWGRPRESIGRASSVRRSSGPGQRIPSGGSATSSDDEKKVSIPHSKPRPMSMSFPTPPPPPKSKKAPTQSTFALPGEAVAAKLKAARLEREKKDDEPKVFKARPVPAMIKNAPVVRGTNTSRARESIGGAPTQPHLLAAHRRASSVAVVRPAEKRQSMSVRPSSGMKSIPAAVVKEVPAVSIRPSSRDKPTTLGADRPSTALANISKPRSPVDVARAALSKVESTVKSMKGREVFARTAFANETAEREKRAKEEATRKARAEAAERSRQLSREWAEKKRREKAESKIGVTPA
ncbi:hypothetical protein AMS68_003779 [Peltaster fructicola]|uniref:Carboxylesterase family protein n=1 Tax=Peltaster fructicola TaxID=286661 RepID=A0A6H0XU10_9PEZI|nr:hypothetical protein AMS68_003779 [Peltaster fructicola]